MKRALSSGSEAASTSALRSRSGGDPPPAQRHKVDRNTGQDDEEENPEEGVFYLRHQNKALAVELHTYKRTIADLERRLATTQRSQQRCDASLAILSRAWQVLDDDLSQAAKAVGVALPDKPPATASNASNSTSTEGNSNSSGGGEGGSSSSAIAASDAEETLEGDLLAALDFALSASSERAAAAAAEGGKTTPQATTDQANCDEQTGSGGGGSGEVTQVPEHLLVAWTSRDALLAPPAEGNASVALGKESGCEKGKKKAEEVVQGRAALTQRVFKALLDALARYFGAASDDSRRMALEKMHGQLLADKRRLSAEAAGLRGLLRAEARRCNDLREELLHVKHQHYRAQRKLDALEADGVIIPKDNVPSSGSTSSSGAATRNASSTAAAAAAAAKPASRGLSTDSTAADAAASSTSTSGLIPGAATSSSLLGTKPEGGQLQNGEKRPATDGGSGAAAAAAAASTGGVVVLPSGVEVGPEVAAALAGSAESDEAAADAAAAAALAEERLKQIEGLEKDKARLERRVLEAVRAPSAEEIAKFPAVAAKDIQLQVAESAVARERELREQLSGRLKEAEGQLWRLKNAHKEEMDKMHALYETRVGHIQASLERTMAESEACARDKEALEAEAGKVPLLSDRAEESEQATARLQDLLQTQRETSLKQREELAAAERQLSDLRTALENAEKRVLEATAAAQEGSAQRTVEAELKEQMERLRQEFASKQRETELSRANNETEINTITVELDKRMVEGKRKQRRLEESEVAHQKVVSELVSARRTAELLRRAEQSKAHSLQVAQQKLLAQEAFVKAVNDRCDALEKRLKHDSDEELELRARLLRESELTDRARGEKMALQAELTHTCKELAVVQTRCEELEASAGEAQAARLQAEGDRVSAQKKAEKMVQKLRKLRGAVQQIGSAPNGDGAHSPEIELLEGENKQLRRQLTCSVCQDRRKSVVIARCGHMFCQECVTVTLRFRSRKCPGCGQAFGQDDVHQIWLT